MEGFAKNFPMPLWLHLDNTGLKLLILGGLFIAAYWIPLSSLSKLWWNNGDYSYGLLIPIISGCLLFSGRKKLKGLPVTSSWAIFPILIIFVLLSLYGTLGSSGNISMPIIPVLIILFAGFCLGPAIAKRILFPLGFLIFMIPIPPILDRSIGVFLKGISSTIGGNFIRMWGIPVCVTGNVVDIGVTQLQVVDACSGIRFLFPLLALGVIYAYLSQRTLWKRILLALATIPLALFTNAFRIGITGILSTRYGTEAATGFFHAFSAWIIFMVAFGCLFLLARVLSLLPLGKDAEAKEVAPGKPPYESASRGGRSAFVASVVLLLVVGVLTWNTQALPPVEIAGGIEGFPLYFAGWSGRSSVVDPAIVSASGAEEAFSGWYKKDVKDEVSLYLGYRATAFLADENFFHSPTVCLPSSGWKVLSQSEHRITHVPCFPNLTVSEMVIERLGEKELVYFWFQTKDKATYDKNINRFHLALHALERRNTYDLFIREIVPIGPTGELDGDHDEQLRSTEERLDGFTRDMMGALLQFLKQNQRIGT